MVIYLFVIIQKVRLINVIMSRHLNCHSIVFGDLHTFSELGTSFTDLKTELPTRCLQNRAALEPKIHKEKRVKTFTGLENGMTSKRDSIYRC